MTTCARCPAPATHACDCGAAGCDEHRGCEHEPERLRAVRGALLAQPERWGDVRAVLARGTK